MKKIIQFVPLTLLFFALIIQACKPQKGSMQAAREAFAKKEYHLAGENYKAVYSKTRNKDEKSEASFQTAECYRLANDMKNAESWYEKALKVDTKNADAQFRLAQTMKSNQKYSEAIAAFNEYKKMAPGETKADEEIKGCEYALKWKNEKTRYVVENVKGINSKWSDFAPSLFRKDILYFTSDREKGASGKTFEWTGNLFTDIYKVTYKADKKNPNNIKYGVPELVDKDKINTPYNDGTAAFDSKGSTMYFTQCNGKDGKGKNCRLFMSTLQGTEWSDPQPLAFSTDSFTCGHPSLTKDGQVLYFASDMPGGQGGKDIWFVTYSKRSKAWGDPVNLGPAINTAGDEVYPFIHEDGTLYFSSNGHVGIGGTDIYYTTGEATDWSTPVNMKSPVNSGGDDFAIVLSKDKESGYLSSNREGGKGQDDIWRFYMTPLVFTLSGVARDLDTKQIMPNTYITITSSSDTGRMIVKTDAAGSYKITLKAKTDYELYGSHEDYLDTKILAQTTKGLEVSTDLVQDLELKPFNYTEKIPVQGIYYDLDKANIRPDAAIILDSLIDVLNKYPRIMIELGSHTDCRSDSSYNLDLSQRRADSAVAYIIKGGIDSVRLIAKGYGESQLVNDCACEGRYMKRQCTEEEHQMNRRTTVRILDKKYVPRNKQEMKDLQNKGKTPATPPKK